MTGHEHLRYAARANGGGVCVEASAERLSANDCICMITAQCHEDGILLTGDRLRSAAEKLGCVFTECSGSLTNSRRQMGVTMRCWSPPWKLGRRIDRCFFPEDLIDQRIQRLRRQNCSGSRPCLDPLRFRYRFPLIRHACTMNRIRVEMENPRIADSFIRYGHALLPIMSKFNGRSAARFRTK